MLSPGNQTWSLGSKAQIDPQPKFVCRGPIQLQDSGVAQKPHAFGGAFSTKGNATKNVALRSRSARTELSTKSHKPSLLFQTVVRGYAAMTASSCPRYPCRKRSLTNGAARADDRDLRADLCRPADPCHDPAADRFSPCRSGCWAAPTTRRKRPPSTPAKAR